MRRLVFLLLALGLLLGADVNSRLLLAVGAGSSFTSPPPSVVAPREALYNGTDSGGDYHIGAATFDGSVWTVYGSNPVITVGAGGTWNDEHVKDPWLMYVSGGYVCYAAGYNGTIWQIGRWTASAISGTWTAYGSNPVVTVGAASSDSEHAVQFPTVLNEPSDTGREWKMWTSGLADDGKYRVIYHYSSDGLSWTTHGTVMEPTTSGTFADEGVVPSAIYKDGSTYHLYGGGRQGDPISRWQGWHTSFSDPETTYTPTQVLSARFNDSGTSQALTANTLSGSTTVTVADTSAFNVNEPVALADVDSGTHISSIGAINSSTQLTLVVAPGENMTTAQSATIRPLAYNSVQPRAVLAASDGGYEMFFTAFQPVDDLSVASPKLREGSMRATSSTLSGSWAYDYTTGLMFPLHDGGWDNLSAENPSVIVAP